MNLKRWSLPRLAAVALLLSACTFQFNTALQADGSGEFRTEVGFTKAEQDALSTVGSSPKQFCQDMSNNQNLGQAPIRVEERGDEVWCVIALPFANLDELRTIYTNMQGVTVNTLSRTGDRFIYDVDINLSSPDTPELGDFKAEYSWQVVMPGTVAEHNADSANGSTLNWDLATNEPVNARAVSTLGGGLGGDGVGLPALGGLSRMQWLIGGLLILCACGAGVGGLGTGAFLLVRRRQPAAGPAAPPPG